MSLHENREALATHSLHSKCSAASPFPLNHLLDNATKKANMNNKTFPHKEGLSHTVVSLKFLADSQWQDSHSDPICSRSIVDLIVCSPSGTAKWPGKDFGAQNRPKNIKNNKNTVNNSKIHINFTSTYINRPSFRHQLHINLTSTAKSNTQRTTKCRHDLKSDCNWNPKQCEKH